MRAVPAADPEEEQDPEQAQKGEPGGVRLAGRDHEQGHEQGAQGLARVATDLEEGLGEAEAAARSGISRPAANSRARSGLGTVFLGCQEMEVSETVCRSDERLR